MTVHRPSEWSPYQSEQTPRSPLESNGVRNGQITVHMMATLRRIFASILPPPLRGMTRFWDEELGFIVWYEPELKRLTVCGLETGKEAKKACLHDRIAPLNTRNSGDFMLFLGRLQQYFEEHPGEWNAASRLRLHEPSKEQMTILKIWPGRFQPRR